MNKVDDTRYIVVLQGMKESLLKSLEKLHNEFPQYEDTKLLLLSSDDDTLSSYENEERVLCLRTSFADKHIESVLSPLSDQIVGVVCRGDMYVQYLRKVLPFLSDKVLVSADRALEISTNKRLMRSAFRDKYPEITPAFIQVRPNDNYSDANFWRTVSFPVIVKPASLASSILIQKCADLEELVKTIDSTLAIVESIYKKEKRSEHPEVIVEEFLEGDFYSIDSYVLSSNETWHLPLVGYLPAEKLGIDDFFLYKRWLPVDLPAEIQKEAFLVADKVIDAIGLTYSSAHIELVHTKNGWKVIEIGPRIGRFRNIMYREAFGIDHGYNDLLIHLGIEPKLESSKLRYVSAYSIYPRTEGRLEEITNLSLVPEKLKVAHKKLNGTIGEDVKFAKNGGHSLFEVVFSSDNLNEHNIQTKWIEQSVHATVSDNSKDGQS